MAYIKKADRRKNQYQKVSFDFKLSVIDEIHNGLISINHAAKVYNISRSSITYWMKKLSSFTQTKKGMSLKEENKKLKERIEALEFMKELQQDIIVDFEKITRQELSNFFFKQKTAYEIARKKKKLTK